MNQKLLWVVSVLFLFEISFLDQVLADGVPAKKAKANQVEVVRVTAQSVAERAGVASQAQEGFRWIVTPLFGMSAIHGSVRQPGVVLNFKTSSADRIRHFRPGGELAIEYSNDKWSFVLQPRYVSVQMDGEVEVPGFQLPSEIKSRVMTFEFRVGRKFTGDNGDFVEVFAGARYTDLNAESQTSFGSQIVQTHYAEPLIGIRARADVVGPLYMEGFASVSGRPSESERTYDLRAGFAYELEEGMELKAGYIYLKTERHEAHDNPVPTDIEYEASGPYIAFSLHF